MKKSILSTAVAAILSISLSGCGGGGGGGSSSNPQSDSDQGSGPNFATATAFQVTVDAPAPLLVKAPQYKDLPVLAQFVSFIVSPAHAAVVPGSELQAVTVDVNGIVTGLPDTQVRDNGDGTYEVQISGDPRIDLLIVSELPGQSFELEVGEPLPDTALFAPAVEVSRDGDQDTFKDLYISPASTAATRVLLQQIETFSAVTVDEVSTLIASALNTAPAANGNESLGNYIQRVQIDLQDEVVNQVNQYQIDQASSSDYQQQAGSYHFDMFGIGVSRYENYSKPSGELQATTSNFWFDTYLWDQIELAYINNDLSFYPDSDSTHERLEVKELGGISSRLELESSTIYGDPIPGVLLAENGQLTLPALSDSGTAIPNADNDAAGNLTFRPLTEGAYVGSFAGKANDRFDDDSFYYLLHSVEPRLFLMSKNEDDFDGEIRGSYGMIGFALEATNESSPQLMVRNVHYLGDITGGDISGAGETTRLETGTTHITETVISNNAVISQSGTNDDISIIQLTTEDGGGLSVRDVTDGANTKEPDGVLSANGQFFWQKAYEQDGADNEAITALTLGLRTDTGATTADLDGYRFHMTGLEFKTSIEDDEIYLEAGELTGSEIRFEDGDLILSGAISFGKVKTSESSLLPIDGVKALSVTMPAQVENGVLTAELNENSRTTSVRGFVGTDENSEEGADALLLSLIISDSETDTEITHITAIGTPR